MRFTKLIIVLYANKILMQLTVQGGSLVPCFLRKFLKMLMSLKSFDKKCLLKMIKV